jgi:hypothetical protein
MLDRLKKHDGVRRLSEVLDELACEPQVGSSVLEARVLVCLRVSVNTNDLVRYGCKNMRSVPLTAGHVDDALATYSACHPLVHHDMTLIPIVLLGHIRECALPSHLESRHSFWLVLLKQRLRRWHGGRILSIQHAA